MSAITDIRCVLTQKALDAFCDKFHIQEEMHPVLPNQNDTMHERPAGKIGLYTRFFDYTNFILPLSTILVDSGWMSFSKHSDNALFPEAFLCLVGLSRHYTLDEETYPWFLHKNGKEMDIFAFIHTPDPTKWQLNRARGFHRRGQDANIQPVVKAVDTVVAHVQPRRQGKRKSMVVDEGEASHPPKKLMEDHGTPSGTFVDGKSWSAIKRLLAGAVLNAEVGVMAIPTLPFVTASVSSMPESEGRDHTNSMAEPNLCTIGASQRFVISSDSSYHSGPTIAEAEVDSLVRSSAPVMTTVTTVTSIVDPALVVKEKPVKPSLFSANSSLAGGIDPNTGVFSDLTCSDFLVGAIRTVINPDTDLQKVYVPQWSVTNGSRLNDGRVCREMVDEFTPPKFFMSVHGMEHDQLFTEFNVGAAGQMSLSAEVRIRAEYNVKEKRRLKYFVERQGELLKVREEEIENLKAQLLLREVEVVKAIHLRAEASNFEIVEKSLRDEVNALKERNAILEKEQNALDVKVTDLEASVVDSKRKCTVYDNCMEQLDKFQDDRMKVVNYKLAKLDVDLAEMACHLDERFYPHLLNTISGRSRAIEKGMQSGLAAGIDHGREGRSLADVAAYNPNVEANFNSALQKFRKVDFPLLAELKSHKDASMEDIINVLRLEGALVDTHGINDLQPNIEQLRVPNHRSKDQVVLGETSLSFALSVSHSRVEQIRENIVARRSTLIGVWTPLSEPLSVTSLMDDYKIVGVDDQEGTGTDGQAVADGNVAPFPNVDDVELNIPQ
ncbi:hypothetical protein Tco_0205250 [Tanacetum coccineum]